MLAVITASAVDQQLVSSTTEYKVSASASRDCLKAMKKSRFELPKKAAGKAADRAGPRMTILIHYHEMHVRLT